MASLADMPRGVLDRIISFGDAAELLNCEKTCTALRAVVADDSNWAQCAGAKCEYYPPIPSHREKACMTLALRFVRRTQKSASGILVKVLSVNQWKDLIGAILNRLLPSEEQIFGSPQALNHRHHFFYLWGDTLGYLIELAEDFLITHFRRALDLCMHKRNDETSPVVEMQDLQMSDWLLGTCMGGNLTRRLFPFSQQEPHQYNGVALLPATRTLIPLESRDRIIRKIAFRAEIPRMDNLVYPHAWTALVYLMIMLLEPACLAFRDREVEAGPVQQQVLALMETIHDVPPNSVGETCAHCGGTKLTHTPVPKQIREAAARIGIPSLVYGNVWLASEGATKDEM